MDDLVVVLVSEELGTWPKRLPDVHSRNNLELEGTTEATYTNLSDRCRIFGAKRGQTSNPASYNKLMAKAEPESRSLPRVILFP